MGLWFVSSAGYESIDISVTSHLVVFTTIIEEGTHVIVFLDILEIEGGKNVVVIFDFLINHVEKLGI